MIKARKSIQEMRTYDPPTESRKGKLRLDFNENTIGCSSKVIKALQKITKEDLSAYPEYNKFYYKLSMFTGINKKNLLLTNGTDEAINVIMNTYIEKGDEILLPDPTYAMFEVYGSINGAKIKKVLYNKDLSFPQKAVLKEINNKTKLVVLVNPNNPTGTIIKNVEEIIKATTNGIVLIDEAYYEYYNKSSKDLLQKYNNIIIIRTFSKVYGLAGIRLGYIMSSKKCISELKKVISPYSVNTPALILANAAIDDQSFVKTYVKEVLKNKKYLQKELSKLGIKSYDSKANYFIADFKILCNEIFKRLNEKKILVRNRTKYPLLKNCLRIGVGNKKQCEILLTALKDTLPKAIIFDIDGVLIDVSNSYRTAIKTTAEFFTKDVISKKDIQNLKEKGGFNNDWDLTEELIRKRNIKIEKKKIINKFQSLYLGKNGLINKETLLINKVILDNLSKKYKLGIVTGRPKKEAIYILQKFGIKKYFKSIIAMEDAKTSKPEPEGINKAIKNLKVRSAIYLGDTIDDMQAAKNAGIIGIGVIPPRCFSKTLSKALLKNGAEIVLAKINEIEKVIL